jgi:NADH-quinone oxidoreductase subunit N
MNLTNISMMRQEVLLAVTILLILIAEIFRKGDGRSIRTFAITLFAIVTAVGFFPVHEGNLFGGMFRETGTLALMKNVLNIAVLIVMFQAYTWLGKAENHEKISEFFILILSTLIGMDFMISSGHFLMFYLGLELASIPIASLAAYERYKNISADAGI